VRLVISMLVAFQANMLTVFPLNSASAANFDQRTFTSAQKAGKVILVNFSAKWCPICTRQKEVIDKLATDPGLRGLGGL
jgi:thioredoxin 1